MIFTLVLSEAWVFPRESLATHALHVANFALGDTHGHRGHVTEYGKKGWVVFFDFIDHRKYVADPEHILKDAET